MRLVCRKWNAVLKCTHSMWKLNISRTPDKWTGLSPFHTYLKHMFLNVRDMSKVYDFFLKNHKFFVYIAGLLMGHFDLGPIVASRDELLVKGYRLNRQSGLSYNGRQMSMDLFLDAYRQSII
jgi:hypothetical protein